MSEPDEETQELKLKLGLLILCALFAIGGSIFYRTVGYPEVGLFFWGIAGFLFMCLFG